MNVAKNRRMRFPLIAITLLALLGLPVLAQQATKTPGGSQPDPKEKVRLMEEGQATLLEAAQIAEKHTKGKALEVDSMIQKTSVPKNDKKDLTPGSAAQQSRLIYRVDCFAQDKTVIARVDGLEKKVIDVIEVGSPVSKGNQ